MPRHRHRRTAQTIRIASVRPGTARAALIIGNAVFTCAIGRSGLRRRKREGDGATPRGSWPLRNILYRADRGPRISSELAAAPINPADGWCDDPRSPLYNRRLRLPSTVGHERLWRDDRLYDRVVVIGYNDRPAVRGHGSAIFIHVAKTGYAATEGCIALAPFDLARLIGRLKRRSTIVI